MAEGESDPAKKRKRDGDIHFREDKELKKKWEEAAEAEGRTLANWLRMAANYRLQNPPHAPLRLMDSGAEGTHYTPGPSKPAKPSKAGRKKAKKRSRK
jgi:hypothetical protein